MYVVPHHIDRSYYYFDIRVCCFFGFFEITHRPRGKEIFVLVLALVDVAITTLFTRYGRYVCNANY